MDCAKCTTFCSKGQDEQTHKRNSLRQITKSDNLRKEEGESKNFMNTEDKRVSTWHKESKEATESRRRLLERSAFQWAMSLLTSVFGTALTLYLIHRL